MSALRRGWDDFQHCLYSSIEVIALRLFSLLAGGVLAATVITVPLDAASAHAVGGCPTPAGFAPVHFGDIPEIDQALFDHFDINGDGTICGVNNGEFTADKAEKRLAVQKDYTKTSTLFEQFVVA